ncbi:hypothetical protein BDP27DRAFT_1311333 [Rhodocollybia butyracea]|uniref:Rho termination factor N-terminal domain-containing protein n=1 Tax=Rhodocollybia butyracea TaxID=206335 RepID=A0A9P5QAA5_9AGAR|nr:hypothetical protein BDP27DRAFT_1311333 [Rhodocollybia butyracea]
MASSSSNTEEALKQLNVAQLKAICKERQIVGYSKLPKPGIINKIISHSTGAQVAPTSARQNEPASDASVAPTQSFARSERHTSVSSPATSSSPLVPVTNLTQNEAHIVAPASTAGAERKRAFEADPMAMDVRHSSVTCSSCDKVVKFNMYDLHLWNRHKTRCKGPSSSHSSSSASVSTSPVIQDKPPPVVVPEVAVTNTTPDTDRSLTAAQRERKKILENDPLASNVGRSSVTCDACGKVIKYNMFDLYHWNRHKTRCKPTDPNVAHSLPISTVASSSKKPKPKPAPKPTSAVRPIIPQTLTAPVLRRVSLKVNPPAEVASSISTPLPDVKRPEASTSATRSTVEIPLTEAQAQRKKTLDEDPFAKNVQRSSVTCSACNKVVKFSMFDLFLWNRHKGRCKEGASISATPMIDTGKRFTPLIVNKNPAPSVDALSSSSSSTPKPLMLKIPAQSSSLAASTARASAVKARDRMKAASEADTSSTFKASTSKLAVPRLKALKESNTTLARKVSSVPDITLEVNSPTSFSLHHLDFPAPAPLTLERITMPPGIAHRKQVASFAIILSQNCLLVSRMFRYAIYLSASTRLARNFAGYRLNRILYRLPANTIDMWPYLLQREGEKKYRKRVFEESFLGRAFKGKTAIAPQLWTSPDNDKQITIAIRFLLTRLFFTISVGGGQNGNGWSDGMIVDTREIIKGEIWCIDVAQAPSSPSTITESFYVLESTCEVVGQAPLPSQPEGSTPEQMRADWSAYIDERMSVSDMARKLDPARSMSAIPATSLMNQLSWTNHEEYMQGISRVWLKRIEIQQGVGGAKRIVAERYILASVVENSVSGRYMTSSEMADDFSGISSTESSSHKKPAKLNLFLPEHHHIESVHFTTAQGLPLHPALAVIQTPHREYYVLRDNGMQIGCEEDGVAEVWREVIGCADNGVRA